jgi:hypothetical protein
MIIVENETTMIMGHVCMHILCRTSSSSVEGNDQKKLMIPKNEIEADKPAKQQTSFHRMERLVRRSLIALGIWSFMALWPWLSWRFFDGSLNISLSDRYILAIYLYALGFILHKALVKPCRKKTDPNVLANVGTEDGYITKRLAEIALRDDLWERNKHSLRGGFLQSEGQVRVECGDADVHVESSPNAIGEGPPSGGSNSPKDVIGGSSPPSR